MGVVKNGCGGEWVMGVERRMGEGWGGEWVMKVGWRMGDEDVV